MFSTKSKIFITGATGFVGSYIVRKLLECGYENLYCLIRKASDRSLIADFFEQVVWLEGDILDMPLILEQTEGMEIVIHAAAQVTFGTKEKKKMIDTAMIGTANLVNASLDNDVKKFIHISSIAAIGRKKKVEHIDEKLLFSHSEFDTTYGLSKFLAEQEVWRGHAEGLSTIILNPSMILGAGNWEESSTQLYKKIYEGLQYYPSGINGWVDVKDVANAVALSINSHLDGKRFIISAENLSYKSVFEKIAANLNVNGPSKGMSNFWAAVIWRVESIRSFLMGTKPIITKETIKSTSVSSYYDNTSSKTYLGLTYTPIDETIAESCTTFLSTFPKGQKWGIVR